nr:hypothetical protein CFP56_20625 [Quercus suber]
MQDCFRLLHQLPEELLQEILCRLESPALSNLALASHWTYVKAAAWIWREVNLVDCRTSHIVWDGYDKDVPVEDDSIFEDDVHGREKHKHIASRYDEHDDTAIIRKLIVLASKPWIAESVQTLTHRCHLPPPAIFNELPHAPFGSQTLSADPRTTRLAHLACQNMTRLHTLRIIFGHPSLIDAILRSLFDKARPRSTPIRRLWLENCRLSAGCESFADAHPFGLDVPLELDFAGIESLRLRRMPLRPGLNTTVALPAYTNVYARSQNWRTLQDGAGGMYVTTMNNFRVDQISHDSWVELGLPVLMSQYALGMQFDDKIYDKLMDNLDSEQREMVLSRHIPAHEERCWKEYRGPYLDPLNLQNVRHDTE